MQNLCFIPEICVCVLVAARDNYNENNILRVWSPSALIYSECELTGGASESFTDLLLPLCSQNILVQKQKTTQSTLEHQHFTW